MTEHADTILSLQVRLERTEAQVQMLLSEASAMETQFDALEALLAEAEEALLEARKQLFALCEDTIEKYHDFIGKEGPQGSFSHGRVKEAKSIRDAMGEVFRPALAKLRERKAALGERT